MAAVANQNPTEVFMLRPASFMFNTETAVTNHFQNKVLCTAIVQCCIVHRCSVQGEPAGDLLQAALAEFDSAVAALREAGIPVTVFNVMSRTAS